MSPFAELLPFVFLGIVIGIFLPAGNISTSRGVRPLSLPYTGDSLRSPSFVAGSMANFLNLIHLVAGFRSAIINTYDLYTTSLRHIFIGTESAATGTPTHPYDILWSEAQAIGWTGLERTSFDILADLEDSLDAQPFEPMYIQYYVTTFLFTILSHPNAIAPGARATFTDHLVSNESDIFNDEYLLPLFTPSDNLIVAEFIIATGNQISPVIIGMLHLAWSDPDVAQTFLDFSYSPSWDRYNRHLSNSQSISQIAHSVHCQSPVWPSEIPVNLSDVEVEFIAALFAVAVFTFHYGSFAVMK